MGGIVKKILPIAISAAGAYFGVPIAGQIAGAAVSSFTSNKPKEAKADPGVAIAQQRQAELLEQQKITQTRQQQATDEREAELSKQLSSQRRAIAARRGGRGSLSFSGSSATAGLATKFGGQ